MEQRPPMTREVLICIGFRHYSVNVHIYYYLLPHSFPWEGLNCDVHTLAGHPDQLGCSRVYRRYSRVPEHEGSRAKVHATPSLGT